jgi:hypothetical protein
MINLCPPALIYVAFSLTQVIIDTFKGLYNLAFFKVIVMIVITILLNSLCQAGMGVVSWIIVFIPFIFMSVIVGILLYVFGFDPITGELNIKCNNCDNTSSDSSGNLVYSRSIKKTDKYKYMDVSYSDTPDPPSSGSSDPEYA